MKATLSIRSLASMAALAAVLGIPAARAGDSCLDEAKQGYKECKDGCTEDFQAAKDACLDRDHVCVEACRAGREDCRAATGVDAAIASCNDTLTAAKQRCRDAHPAGSPERDQCIDQAQLVAFQCRLDANPPAQPALSEFRMILNICARSCSHNVPTIPDGGKQ